VTGNPPDPIASQVALDESTDLGFRRTAALQDQFDQAAESLRQSDGWANPAKAGAKELVADLALEGGGVKGIGLVGVVLALSEAGYRFQRVAGTSAGAIAASLIAAITAAGQPMTRLRTSLETLDFTNFMPESTLRKMWEGRTGKIGEFIDDAAALTHKMGIYPGDYLERWLGPILADLGVSTFSDLKLTQADDPGMSLPNGHTYRLLVHTSDITRAQLVRLPWDYPFYGHNPDNESVAHAVRASMSIPFFFEPVTFDAVSANIDLPRPDGGVVAQEYEGGSVTWVDGGMLRNFPIDAFNRADGTAPRWPTIGIKLSSLQTLFPQTEGAKDVLQVAIRALRTMMNEWDSYAIDEGTAGRTVFVDNLGLTATQFDLTSDQQNGLFLNGVAAGTSFVIEMAAAGRVPRTADEAMAMSRGRLRV